MNIAVHQDFQETGKKIILYTGNSPAAGKPEDDSFCLDCSDVRGLEKLAAYFRRLGKQRGEECQICTDSFLLPDEDFVTAVKTAVLSLYDGAYSFEKQTLKELDREQIYEQRDRLASFGETSYIFTGGRTRLLEQAVEQGILEGTCKGYARTLGNLPNNYLHTEDMVCYVKKLGGELSVSCRILGNRELKEMGCGGLLAVNQGSSREAAMAVLTYTGVKDAPYLGMVGKGLMFDSGGYHLKSLDGMNGMKFDMCGAAGVLEAFEILVRRQVKKNLIAVLTLAENVISPDAVKMGDVVTMLSGHTVEVYNTDAEGRLVLADGITYAQMMGAEKVLDLATLTYSAQAALGDQIVGLFVNGDDTYADWKRSALHTGEKFWRLPLDEIYHDMLTWPVCADFANYAPGKGAAACTAACFLENFVEEGNCWIHLDMVGPSVVRSETQEMAEGASGACISTIVNYVEEN